MLVFRPGAINSIVPANALHMATFAFLGLSFRRRQPDLSHIAVGRT